MKKISSKIFVALSGIMALGVSVPAVAQTQTPASTIGSGSITIVRPLTMTKSTDIKFGTIIKPTSGSGSVAVTAAATSVRSVSGNDVVALATGASASAATFTLNGEGGQVVSVIVPPNFEMTNASGGNKLTVNTSNNLEPTVILSGQLGDDSAGTSVFYVGGNVTIAADTAPGAYTGSFTVTASYN